MYAYVLMFASNMISDGSELLLLIPSLAGLVGSVVLPVLGAVPDGCIVLFSGIGPTAQEQLSVGIGALAGSTIMLLTAPWFLSVLGGRVNFGSDGKPDYKKKNNFPTDIEKWWFSTGVSLAPNVQTGGFLMTVTSITYLIIEAPAMVFGHKYFGEDIPVGQAEIPYALVALLSSSGMFFGYLYYKCYLNTTSIDEAKRIEKIIEKIKKNEITLRGIIQAELKDKKVRKSSQSAAEAGESSKLIMKNEVKKSLESIVKPFFQKYDIDDNKKLDLTELGSLLKELGESEAKKYFKKFDTNKDGVIDYQEFIEGITEYALTEEIKLTKEVKEAVTSDEIELIRKKNEADEEGDEEEEEMPEEFLEIKDPDEQQAAIGNKAAWMLSIGTFLVVLFSDPMVDVLNELGVRTSIPPFYVSFVLAPLASNASEVIASYNYAQKKTVKSMEISLSALQGACCMNNTFVLAIFMICVYTQSLAWQFFAETVSILFSVLFIAAMSLKNHHTMFDALLIMMMYPMALVIVYTLEANGFD